ncbi:hypothetical protein CRM22_000856 [Opisthorchis felineus]|uniref:RUN domain-containing protein n=1 Tax=Opisthorchis felineus TaxID=147828 RepID=A0A4S2MDF8_OPIFE|nr:hypothetical protein CRM22_000856 [Opisthorchis felineus]
MERDSVKNDLLDAFRIHSNILLKDYEERRFEHVRDDTTTAYVCSILEAVFLHKLIRRHGTFFSFNSTSSPEQASFWNFIKGLIPKHLLSVLDSIGGKRTAIGRCRVWIRHCLNEASMHSYLVLASADTSKLNNFYSADAALRDENFMYDLLALVDVLEELRFRLDLTSPLLNTWISSAAPKLLGWVPASPHHIGVIDGDSTSWSATTPDRPDAAPLSDYLLEPPAYYLDMALGTLRRSSIASCTHDTFDPASTVDKCMDSLSDKMDDNDLFCKPETSELNPHTQEISSSPNVRSSGTHCQPSNNKREISKKRKRRKQQIQVAWNIFPVGSNNIINQSRATWLIAFESDLPTSDDESTLKTSSPVLPTVDEQSASFPVVIQAKQADVAEGESNWQVVGEDLLVTLTEQDITRLVRLFPGAPAFDLEDGRNCAFNGKCGRCDKQLSPTTAFLDSYDARLYCMNCHQLQEAIIPRDVIYNWDFSLQPVSQPTRSFLGELFNRPLINLAKIHPSLYAVIPELLVIRQLRRALILLWHQIARCDAKSASDLQRCIRPLDYMLISLNDLDLYSMHDLYRVQSGELQKKLMTAICDVALVHVHGCRACRRRALLCDLCGDVERPIWPHEFTTYKWCSTPGCIRVMHVNCLDTANDLRCRTTLCLGCPAPSVTSMKSDHLRMKPRCRTCLFDQVSKNSAGVGHYADPFIPSVVDPLCGRD